MVANCSPHIAENLCSYYLDVPVILQPDAVLKSLLVGLASGVVVRLVIHSTASEGYDAGLEIPVECIVSWVCDVSFIHLIPLYSKICCLAHFLGFF